MTKPYKDVRLVQGKRQYISYYYLIPDELADRYKEKGWKRFRVFEGINRRNREPGFEELLLHTVRETLAAGYNPFTQEAAVLEEIIRAIPATPVTPPGISLYGAMDAFIKDCEAKQLRPRTIGSYQTLVNFLTLYFGPGTTWKDLKKNPGLELTGHKLYRPASELTFEDIKEFLSFLREEEEWSGQTYNNKLGYLHVIFNWMADKGQKIITASPLEGLKEMPVDGKTHEYYQDSQAAAVKAMLLGGDARMQYVYKFCEFIYYTGTRPVEEARYLCVKDVLFDRKKLRIPGDVSKTREAEYITMGEDLIALLKSMDIEKYPADYYLFSAYQRPDKDPASHNYFATNFRPVKTKLELPDHTIYSWKHTRAIHLAEAGASPYQIQALFRHASLEETEKYLRNLGCRITGEINEKTRKF